MQNRLWNRSQILLVAAVLCLLGGEAVAQEPGKAPSTMSVETAPKVTRRYKVVRKNGGPNGYNIVQEQQDDASGIDVHLLICINPGWSGAEFSVLPLQKEAHPRLLMYAEEQIEHGTTTGVHTLQENGTRYVVSWEGADTSNCTIEEIHYRME